MQYKPGRARPGQAKPRERRRRKHPSQLPKPKPNRPTQLKACSHIGPPPDYRKKPLIPWATPPRRKMFTLESRFCGEDAADSDGRSWHSD